MKMKLKDKLIRKLLDTGKKHRILVYPTLALVAIISAISHAVYWGRGNGKKLVASIMVMTMLITQSLFLTSSADVGDSPMVGTNATPTDAFTSDEISSFSEEPILGTVVYLYRIDEGGHGHKLSSYPITVDSSNPVITVPSAATLSEYLFGADQTEYVDFTDVCTDMSLSQSVSGTLDVSTLAPTGGEYNLYFKATRHSYPIYITDDEDKATKSGMALNTVTISAPATYTPDSGDIYPALSYTIGDAASYGLYRYGYDFSGVSFNNGAYAIGSTIEINTSESNAMDVYGITTVSTWSPMKFEVTYNATPAGSPASLVVDSSVSTDGTDTYEYEFGKDYNVVSSSEVWASNEAYVLSGWKEDGSDTVYAAGDVVNSMYLANKNGEVGTGVNITGKSYSAIWSYKNIQLKAKQGIVSEDGQNLLVEATYGDTIECNVTALYKDEASSSGSKFTYELPDGIGELGSYGLGIRQESDGSYTIFGSLSDVTPEGGVSITLKVTDGNVNEGEADRVSTHIITFVSKQREVKIFPGSIVDLSGNQPNKIYDGTKDISIAPKANVTGTIGNDQIYVELGTAAYLDDDNAGTRSLTVTVVGLKCDALNGSEIAERYFITTDENSQLTFENSAVVERKPISVEIVLQADQDSTVLFGEKTPDYSLRVTGDSVGKLVGSDAEAYNGITSESGYEYYMKDILGFSSWNISRSIYSSTGTYTVGASFVPDGKNYAVTVVNAPTFTVTRDAGVKYTGSNDDSANYKFNKEKLPNGYYPGLTITADGTNYNAIRLVGTTQGDITVDMTKEQAEGLFTPAIVLDDMVNGTISFQMLNTGTGAITEIVTLTGINVDTSAPVLKNFIVSPYLDYFNEFAFGSYFHSQVIDGQEVSSINIKVQYDATGSRPDKLYYYFVDENGNRTDVSVYEKPLVLNDASGYYEASVLIGPTVYGQLVVYASDETGNMSTLSTLKIKDKKEEIEEYLNSGSAQSYFEWMVENNIQSTQIEATNLAGETAAVSGSEAKVWYNGINLKAVAADDAEIDSGVNRIEWTITKADGTSYDVTEYAGDVVASVLNIEEYGKIRSYAFTHSIQDASLPIGYYTVSAVVYDNAGNSVELTPVGPFLIDCQAPVITDNTKVGAESYLSGVTLEFTVSDSESETIEDVDGSGVSGVQTVTLYKKEGTELTEIRTWGDLESYAYNITNNGTYVIEAKDAAGNVSTYEKTFTGISDIPPLAPTITVTGTIGNNGWYINEKPYITINSTTDIEGIPVVTKYSTEVGNKYIQDGFSNDFYEFQLEQEGVVTVSAWAVSASGVTSIDTDVEEVKVDLQAPEVYVVESTVADDGSMTVNFRATDSISGVETTKVLLNGEPIEVTEVDGVISGSFIALEGSTYTITVEDKAGNVSEPLEFSPLALIGYPVTGITTTGAYVEAEVHEGTYPVSDCYVAYKKASDSEYTVALFNKPETEYGMDINCTFRNLEADTVYDYKIYVKTDVSEEVRTIEGSFKTASKTATAVVYGTAVYDTSDANIKDEYPIYVTLYEANTVISSEKLVDSTTTAYMFKNVPNGTYRIVATDGYYTKTASVTVENGGITYPTDYIETDGINFVLNGKSTNVVIEDNSINITADELESIYDNTLYEGIITPEDEAVVAAGGTIDVTLYASYMNVSDVSAEEQSVFDAKIGENAIIERYIQLYVVKEVRNAEGTLVNNTPEYVTELYHPVTITFPLGELSGEKIYVASVHGTGNNNFVFKDWKNADDVVLTNNTVTITTRYFSVYALYRTIDTPKYYTVKWVDGDGKVMKTEQVESGKSATPPTETPTKSPSSKYTYKFSKWDKDYTNITSDTVISAWFTAHEIKDNDSDKPDDGKDDNNTTDPDKNPGTDPGTDPDKNPGDGSGDDTGKDATVTPPTTQQPQYGYMGSADSPKTGDATPIVVLILAMIMSAAGMVVLKKKAE